MRGTLAAWVPKKGSSGPLVPAPKSPITAGNIQVRYSDSFYDRLFTDGHYTAVGCTVPHGEIVAVAAVRIVQRGQDAPPGQRNQREVLSACGIDAPTPRPLSCQLPTHQSAWPLPRQAYIMTLGVKVCGRLARRSLPPA